MVFIPQNIWEKQLIHLGYVQDEILGTTILTVLSQNLCCKQRKQDGVIDASFRLYGEFQAEKYSMVFLWNSWNDLTRMQRKKDTYCTSGGSAVLIATGANLLNTKYSFMDSMMI